MTDQLDNHTPEEQANIDRLARELYDQVKQCGGCHAPICLADQLLGKCPQCGALVLAGPIMPERAREMLPELKARRVQLGLSE